MMTIKKIIIGQKAELLAKKYLINKKYEILGVDVRWKKVQIDILAKFNNRIIAIEVKYRSNYNYFSIKKTQFNNLCKYLDEHYPNDERSIECILITPKKIEHFEVNCNEV